MSKNSLSIKAYFSDLEEFEEIKKRLILRQIVL